MRVGEVSYIDDASLVSEPQVSEEAGLGQVPQLDHVIHPLHWCRVHDPERGFLLLGQSSFLREVEVWSKTNGVR